MIYSYSPAYNSQTADIDIVPSDLQALLERDDAMAEIKRLKELLRENGIKTE